MRTTNQYATCKARWLESGTPNKGSKTQSVTGYLVVGSHTVAPNHHGAKCPA